MPAFKEPGHMTRRQQAELARLNVNHVANLPRAAGGNLFAEAMFDVTWPFPKPVKAAEVPFDAAALERAVNLIRGVSKPQVPDLPEQVMKARDLATIVGPLVQTIRDAYVAARVDHFKLGNCADRQPHTSAITAFMVTFGWTLAGSGHFSLAYTKDDLCIKIGLKAEDSGAAYAAWCRDNKGMPGLPEIHDMQRHGRNCYTIVMPAYKPLVSGEKSATSQAIAIKYEGHYLNGTWKAIHAFFEGMAEFDLHGDNVMQDDYGNLIITDPVSFRRGDAALEN